MMQGIPQPLKKRRLVRWKEAYEMYGIGKTKFREIAKNAGAVIKVGTMVLIDLDTVDEYLETFRLPKEDYY